MSTTVNSGATATPALGDGADSFEDTASGATLSLTNAAAEKVYSLMLEENNLQLKLRVYITGGGCSGFQYGFTFEEQVAEDDTQFTKEILWPVASSDCGDAVSSPENIDPSKVEVTLLVDPLSFPYLSSAEIDYREDVNGAQFVIRNPNAKTTCGCGSSFSA